MSRRSHGLPHSYYSPIDLEHRLTILEVTTDDHGERLTTLETKSPRWQPRDLILAAAGVVMLSAAIAEKIGWTTALAAFAKIYGAR